MALSQVGTPARANATTITLPAHQAGDIIVVVASRVSNTPPTVPAGFTAFSNPTGTGTQSHAAGWKKAASSSETSGTWTNAGDLEAVVYRGGDQTTPIGAVATPATGTTTTLSFPALSLQKTDGTSWVFGYGQLKNTNGVPATNPAGMTNRASGTWPATASSVDSIKDTNGGVASWSAQTAAWGGTAAQWRAFTAELRAATAPVITSQPSNATVTVGQTATFTVVATNNDISAMSYQWQGSEDEGATWQNISGATSASYTTPVLGGSDNTHDYRCLVTNAQGTTTSSVAALTVNALLKKRSMMLLGVGRKSGFIGALDGLANKPTVVWAFRRMLTSYTGKLIRIRHGTSNVEYDVGYDATGELDTAYITSVIGSASAYLVKVYNQGLGGATYDWAQATAGTQPRIVNAGTLDVYNAKAAFYQTTANAMDKLFTSSTTWALCYVARWISNASGRILGESWDQSSTFKCFGWQVGQYMRVNLDNTFNWAQANQDTNMHVIAMRVVATVVQKGWRDGTEVAQDNVGAAGAVNGLNSNGGSAGNSSESQVGAVCFWDGTTVDADITTTIAAMKSRYGIA